MIVRLKECLCSCLLIRTSLGETQERKSLPMKCGTAHDRLSRLTGCKSETRCPISVRKTLQLCPISVREILQLYHGLYDGMN